MGKFADSRILMGTLIVTLLALAYLGLAPTNDASFSCQTLPVVRMVNPEAEAAPPGFFDSGTQCNADAQGRARSMGLVLVSGAMATAIAALLAHRRNQRGSARPAQPEPASGREESSR